MEQQDRKRFSFVVVDDQSARVNPAARSIGYNPYREISSQAAALIRAYAGLPALTLLLR